MGLALEEGVNEREPRGVAGKRRSKRRHRLFQRALSVAWISSNDGARQMTRSSPLEATRPGPK